MIMVWRFPSDQEAFWKHYFKSLAVGKPFQIHRNQTGAVRLLNLHHQLIQLTRQRGYNILQLKRKYGGGNGAAAKGAFKVQLINVHQVFFL